MLAATDPRPLTPYQWCVHHEAREGDRVRAVYANLAVLEFTIIRIDHATNTVRYGLPDAWADRVWMAMDGDAEYSVLKKDGGVKV